MNEAALLAYAQVRLQARHGARPDAQVWNRLHSIGDVGNYLLAARETMLRPWVVGLDGAAQNSHRIEHALRQRYRGYVHEVSRWMPQRWIGAVLWIKRLPDLPALHHLLMGEAAPAWMRDDPELRLFTAEATSVRMEAMLDSDYAPLVQAWQEGKFLHDAWLEHWRRLWPRSPRLTAGLRELARLLHRQFEALREESESTFSGAHQHNARAHKLEAVFRRYSFQPAAAHAHLALIGLDIERLRGDLTIRLLFPEIIRTAQ